MSFELKAPLVRVKTPSFPLTICRPDSVPQTGLSYRETQDSERIDLVSVDELVDFILWDEQSKSAARTYQQQCK